MKTASYLFTVLLIFNSCKTDLKKDLCRYAYKTPKNHFDSLNYVLPINDYPFDSTAIDNSRQFLEAFEEPNISLKGSDTPIIRLVVYGLSKPGSLIIRIKGNTLLKKKPLSGNWYPEVQPDSLSKSEKRDYYILRHNLGIRRASTDKIIAFNDSVSKTNPLLYSRNYYDSLVRKATPASDFTYQSDRIELSNQSVNRLYSLLNTPNLLKLPPIDIKENSGNTDEGGYYIEVNTMSGYSLLQQSGNSGNRTAVINLYNLILDLAGIRNTNNE